MISLEDLKDYFFIVTQSPNNNSIIILVQAKHTDERKFSHIKEFSENEFRHSVGNIEEAKAITLLELLENLNKELPNE